MTQAAAIRPAPARTARPKRARWGWLEWFVIAQTFIPALLFLPGISAVRTPIRVLSYFVAMIAWAGIELLSRRRPGASAFSAGLLLRATAGLLLLLVFHPGTNSLLAGLAQAMLYIAIFCPAFWVAGATTSKKQLGRVMLILLACNGLSSVVGIGQVFRPETFNPPYIPSMDEKIVGEVTPLSLSYEDERGRKIIRPCGLTDQAGAASGAGAVAATVGLACALYPMNPILRLLSLACSFFGIAVIYYSQVRFTLVMFVICLIVLTGIFVLQRRVVQAGILAASGVALIGGAMAWVMATSGASVVERYTSFFDQSLSRTYEDSHRGMFVQEAFERTLVENPFGVGLGWWGTIYGAFGDKTVPTKVWVEVMIPAWITDGGLPLLALYCGSIGLAMWDTLRIARKSRDKEISYWAAVVFASNLGVVATCFSYVSFASPIGIQFWLLAALVNAADLRSRSEAAAAAAAQRRPAGPAVSGRPSVLSPGPPPPRIAPA